MPWTKKDYPNSMKNLPEEVRNKAIEIGNALIEEGELEEGIAIATAISGAKDWAAHRGKEFENPERSKITDVKKHGEDRVVIPYESEWAVKVEGDDDVEQVFHSKKEAVKQARQEAKEANAVLTIQGKTGRVQKRISYNPANRSSRRKNTTKPEAKENRMIH